jgi:hypothetical protein
MVRKGLAGFWQDQRPQVRAALHALYCCKYSLWNCCAKKCDRWSHLMRPRQHTRRTPAPLSRGSSRWRLPRIFLGAQIHQICACTPGKSFRPADSSRPRVVHCAKQMYGSASSDQNIILEVKECRYAVNAGPRSPGACDRALSPLDPCPF